MITKKTIEHVANLARLNISEEEKEQMTQEMESILAYVDKLNQLDTGDVEPQAHVIPMYNVFREDEVRPSYDREDIVKNAPVSDEGCFKVPQVVE